MPFTPFHFGPGALVHAAARKHISFLAFCGANVLVDVEPLYFMLTQQDPIHRFFHTYIGVTLGAFAGTYSHVVLDSLMHADMRPFAPFSDANPLSPLVGADQHALGEHVSLDLVEQFRAPRA